jgi:O-methyltransferase involved in polyketide biosynthesis
MKEAYEKISPTAMVVAYLRTFTNIAFAKEMAEQSHAEKIFRELVGERSESLVRLAPIWEARYKLTDRIIVQRGITQILEVGAGLSPRGLAMTEKSDVVYVVTELPQILAQVKSMIESILSKSNAHHPNLYFEAANALDLESLSKATTHFRPERSAAIVTEGLFSYLSSEERTVLASNIYTLLKKFGGIWITTEVHTQQEMKEASQLDILRQLRLALATPISESTGRDAQNNLFADDNELKRFFNDAGFDISKSQYSSVLPELSSIKILNLTQQEMQRLEQGFRFYNTLILTPQKK